MNRISEYTSDDGNYKFGNRFGDELVNDARQAQQYRQRIDEVENESLESTYRALRLVNEASEVGTQTAAELNRQGDQLRGIDQKLDDINDNLNTTQKHLNNIKSVFGGIKNKFFSWSSSSSSSTSTTSTASSKPDSMSKSSSSQSFKPSQSSQQISKQEYVSITGSAREDQMHQNLDELSKGLSLLQNLAQDMSSELDRQNPLIERLDEKVNKTKGRIDNQNTQMKKIQKS